jgi:D-beta-D-heptose 7-phosphate kinase/D-beta-D-heptose 1-phosphate adenosyltransferase
MDKIAFCAGCFDSVPDNLPHPGHLYLLKTAKELCNYLVIGVNSDQYIRNKKNREPLTTQSKRIEALYNTGLVNECIPFESDPLPIILFLKPDLLIVGSDYSEDKDRKSVV